MNPKLCVTPRDTIRQAIAYMNENVKGIVLVVAPDGQLLGTVTDGDLRRAFLNGRNLETLVSELLADKQKSPHPTPVTAKCRSEHSILLQMMRHHCVNHLPLLDDDGRVVDLVTLKDLIPGRATPLKAVIMAWGYGMGLRPLTETVPKPLLLVGDRPLMERIIQQLHETGVRHVSITTYYLAEKIMEYFGDGRDFGVELSYLNEDSPLGTAGGLGLMPDFKGPLLVVNGDILTEVNFRAMLAYHEEHQAVLTVAVHKYDIEVPYGVVESDGPFVRSLVEKPSKSFFVNAGIYFLEPAARRYIPVGQRFEMTDLIQRLLLEGQPVVNFPILESWLDIGRQAAYGRAQEIVGKGEVQT